MRASPESPRMFESDFLDFFTRTPWFVVPALWLPMVAGTFGWGLVEKKLDILVSVAVFLLFIGVWTLAEYLLHRFVFHWVPKTRWGPTFHFFAHGVHHQWPSDRYRLVMPPAAAALLAPLFYGLFRLLLGPAWVFPAFAGFMLGYVVYDCTHYALHHLRLDHPAFKRLRAHHMNHHHNHDDRRFGVSSMFWDRVFGTC